MKKQNCDKGQKDLQEKVIDSHLCTGCGACVNICPYQKAYGDHIIVMDPCDHIDGNCYAFCPRTPTDLDALREKLFDKGDMTPELGAMKAFYITRAKDEQLRKNAQHGGTVSALMALALEEGLIDTAVVSNPGDALLPNGTSAADAASVKQNAKSHFCVTPTVAEFNRVAGEEGPAAIGVVGMPCQALALAKMKMTADHSRQIQMDKLKLVIGLFCGWALSWHSIKELMAKKGIATKDITGMDIPPSKYQILEVYTADETVEIPLDDVTPCVREACRYCFDMTAEFCDLSVGSARLPEGWEVSRKWNQVIVRSERGQKLMELAKAKNILKFHDVPEGNLDRLKTASMNKKRTAVKNLIEKSGSPDDLLYLDRNDSVLSAIGA